MRMLSFIIAGQAGDDWMPVPGYGETIAQISRTGAFSSFPQFAWLQLYIEIECDDADAGRPFDTRIDFTDESGDVLATSHNEIVWPVRDDAYVPPRIRIITDRWSVEVPRPGRYEFRLYLGEDLVGWRAWGISQLTEDPDSITP